MDGSQLCHHGLCVNPNHIVYKPGHENQDRVRCYGGEQHASARWRRQWYLDGDPKEIFAA